MARTSFATITRVAKSRVSVPAASAVRAKRHADIDAESTVSSWTVPEAVLRAKEATAVTLRPTRMRATRRASSQAPRAVVDGVAAFVRDRLVRACTAAGAELAYHWTVATVLVRYLDRAASERDPTMADVLRRELANDDPAAADAARTVDVLDVLFDCP